ncbi:ZIP-like iron-zinc transporter [Mycena sanguinolenta]|uniref:ZIP-like iron-zinc transporter n=1 Tax=Mycena sanguinolenta TaxID=230812 RepID=A0A8H7DDB3_9AGAR|nr:ZIP-like iron-zinc transporter [Mycena sanguinolenta]
MSSDECIAVNNPNTYMQLRVASVFIILVCATSGTLFPVLARRSEWLHVPKSVFNFAKYFGSGVIIATAFIHLLSPGLEELSSPCLSPAWSDYPYGMALCLLSIFSIFILELIAFRWGTSKLEKIGLRHGKYFEESADHYYNSSLQIHTGITQARTPRMAPKEHKHPRKRAVISKRKNTVVITTMSTATATEGYRILMTLPLPKYVLIGLTLAVDEGFKILFIVIIFHQTFEGLGLGSRLAFIQLPPRYNLVPVIAAIIFGLSTPVGIAVGLGLRSTYNPGSATASIVSGVLDSLSAGILIYTGLVELLAHEFLFNKEMMNSSNGNLAYAIGTMLLGCGVMALLGRWA